jgi:hypothetical protein
MGGRQEQDKKDSEKDQESGKARGRRFQKNKQKKSKAMLIFLFQGERKNGGKPSPFSAHPLPADPAKSAHTSFRLDRCVMATSP